MNERGTAREELVEAPAHRDDYQEESQHHRSGMVAEPGLAEKVVQKPAHSDRRGRDQDALPERQVRPGRVEQVQLSAEPVDDHEEYSARQPRRVALPLEPDQVLRHVLWRDEVFPDVVEAAPVHLPFFAMHACGQVGCFLQPEIERDEIERRANPCDRRDDVEPAYREGHPVPDCGEVVHGVPPLISIPGQTRRASIVLVLR